MSYLFTSESVSEGHPDKVSDQVSDAIIDNFLAFDPDSKVACETLVTTGQVVLAGEVKTQTYLDVQKIARDVINKIGYTKGELLRAGYSAKQAGYNTEKPAVAKPAAHHYARRDNNMPHRNSENSASNISGSASLPAIGSNSPEARLRAIQKLQQEELNRQQQRDMMQQMQGQMSLQAQKMMAALSNHSTQAYAQGMQVPAVGAAAGVGKGGVAKLTGPVIKAGTIMFAVLDTGINSDEKSPILAEMENSGEIKIVGASYAVETGEVTFL